MIQKIKAYLDSHKSEYELLRYVIAGGLTTLLSFCVFSLFCMAVSPEHTVNSATDAQALTGNVVSWVVAVLFAFWINRRMVFRVRGGEASLILKELGQFVFSRLISLAIFELGLMWFLLQMGLSNFISKLIVQVLVIVFNYVVSKFWIFAKKPLASPAPSTPQETEADCPETKPTRNP